MFYFLLARLFPEWQWPEVSEFTWALKNSFIQATGSSFVAVGAGLFLLLGLLRLPMRIRALFSWALLTPSFFPPLFLLLSFMSWIQPFPMGWIGIVLIQGFMNAGLISVLLLQVVEAQLAGLSEAALVMGAGRGLFLRHCASLVFPEILSLGLFVFAVSFASFSIPLVVGGGNSTNIEILIFEKIKISAQWGQALSLSVIQLLIVVGFMFLPKSTWRREVGRAVDLRAWGSSVCLAVVGAYLMMFWAPLVVHLSSGVSAINSMPGLWDEILELLVPSLLVAFFVGLFCLCLFLFFALGFPENRVPSFLRGWLAPSTALLGFAFLFFSDKNIWFSYVFALTLIFFPIIYRLGMDRGLESLTGQIEIARTLGANDLLIWRRILIPQVWSLACILSGVASLWALGEFALGRMILGGPKTLALLSQSLLASYRIDAGLGVGTLILLCGSLMFLFFWGGTRVGR